METTITYDTVKALVANPPSMGNRPNFSIFPPSATISPVRSKESNAPNPKSTDGEGSCQVLQRTHSSVQRPSTLYYSTSQTILEYQNSLRSWTTSATSYHTLVSKCSVSRQHSNARRTTTTQHATYIMLCMARSMRTSTMPSKSLLPIIHPQLDGIS